MTSVFLHGLDSSSQGTKAKWFREHFPDMVIPDFIGSLTERMEKLNTLLSGRSDLVLIGSSFGGLMATIYALENESRVRKVFLLAPALNFPGVPEKVDRKLNVPATLYIGRRDDVCPPDQVIPAARQIFAHLSVHVSDDDHLLRDTFPAIDWETLLRE